MCKIADDLFSVFLICIVVTGVGLGVVLPMWELKRYYENKDKHILLETNELGCSRYSYNRINYWKCPDKSISSVEVNGYKGYTKQEPVVK